MASIYKPKGSKNWRAVIRMKGHPTICDHFERKQEAEDWAQQVERQIKLGQYKFDQHKKLYTFNELIDRYTLDGALEHHRSADDTKRHLAYWKSHLGAYALVHRNSGLLGQERRLLIDTPTQKGGKRDHLLTTAFKIWISYGQRIDSDFLYAFLKMMAVPGQ